MLILDTNHIDILMYEGPRQDLLRARLNAYTGEVYTTIITVQESVEGWFNKVNDGRASSLEYVRYYRKLEGLVSFYSKWRILSFDERAAQQYDRLKSHRAASRRMNDLKIAAIALCNRATVLTANVRDFDNIEGLSIEDWSLDPPLDVPPA